jgi:hypothetical protein
MSICPCANFMLGLYEKIYVLVNKMVCVIMSVCVSVNIQCSIYILKLYMLQLIKDTSDIPELINNLFC